MKRLRAAWLKDDRLFGTQEEIRATALADHFKSYKNKSDVMESARENATNYGKLLRELDEPRGVESVFTHFAELKPAVYAVQRPVPAGVVDLMDGKLLASRQEARTILGRTIKGQIDEKNTIVQGLYAKYMGLPELESWAIELRAYSTADRSLGPT